MLAVVASRTRVTVPVVGVVAGQGGDPGSVGLGPRLLRQALWRAGPVACRPASMTSARSIWSQAAPKFSPTGPRLGAAGDAVFHEPGGLGLVRVGAGAGVDAQLGLQRLADRAGVDEADQAAGEDRRLRPGGQPDGQPPGGDVVDGAAPGVGGGDAVADQPLVQRAGPGAGSPRRSSQGASDPVPGRRAGSRWGGGGRWAGSGDGAVCAVRLSRRYRGGPRARSSGSAGLPSGFGVSHRLAALGGDAEELLQVLAGDQATPADLDVGQVAAAHLVV